MQDYLKKYVNEASRNLLSKQTNKEKQGGDQKLVTDYLHKDEVKE